MGLDPAAEAGLRRRTGLAPMPTAAGLQALYDVLAAGETHAMVLHGEAVRLRGGHPVRQQAEPSAPVDAAVSEDRVPGDLASRVLAALTGLIAKHLRIPKDRIRPGELLETYGVDSLNGTELNQQLEDIFPGLSRTIFYEYPRFAELADHLVAEYPDTCAVWAGVAVKTTATPAPLKPAPMQPAPMVARSATPAPAVRIPRSDTTSGAEPVAVIGISARFPAAEDVEAFYANLLAGRESISEVPADRWAWRTPAGADPAGEAGRWGGFLDNAYGFDPLFFGITPRDAARIDPQERLFLQEAWHALEDAGYAPACLPDDVKANGGVFAGITKQGFNLWAAEGEYLATSFSSMVNRVSHHLDLRGPSLAFDTMCSSALVALHEACDFLRNRGGRIALVGGVNLYLHPHNFDGLAAGQSLAPGRHCTAFAADGTGFVPGEGVGALVLKPYADALRDGDDIQAMIRASAVSHAGARGGYGTPNPAQQEAVIRAALAQADIDPRTITYIESAANGQAAADAVEMTALSKAFALRDGANGDYRVGSVKPNIGHAESASGVAQLAKVLMALKHRRIPATLLHGVRNPNIAFDRLPFALQTEMGRWHRVAIDGAEVPRRAGVTAIGASGVCAHVIVEEAPARETVHARAVVPGDRLFVLSARTPDALAALAGRWIRFLEEARDLDPDDLAYTLWSGRMPFDCRLAIRAGGPTGLMSRLRAWVQPEGDVTGIWTDETVGDSAEGAQDDLDAAAVRWVRGETVDRPGAADSAARRIAGLPTYPFEHRDCRPVQTGVSVPPERHVHQNKAAEFYAIAAESAQSSFSKEYLTFAPFPERVPGFSVTRVCLDPARYPDEIAMVKARQQEMRDVLFGMVDFGRIGKLLDFGCGHGTDVIALAEAHPGLTAHGMTITRSQAKLGNLRIRERGLGDRVRIVQGDSASDPFPAEDYDLVIGIEVSFHIRDKARLFANIVRSLRDNGTILLADYIAKTRGPIVDPNIEVTIPTQAQWAKLLSDAGLRVETYVDVSQGISNFLHDPNFEANIRDLPEVGRRTWTNYVNQSKALERGQIIYSLIRLVLDRRTDAAELHRINSERLAAPVPYEPPAGTDSIRVVVPAPRPEVAETATVDEVRDILAQEFARVLDLGSGDLRPGVTFTSLGVGSINAVDLLEAINARFDLHLPTSVVFEHDTLDALATQVLASLAPGWRAEGATNRVKEPAPATMPALRSPAMPEPIAVIGMSCRCAGADNADELWSLVREGRDCLSDMPANWAERLAALSGKPVATRYGRMVDPEVFDPFFFRISPREAEHMDLNQRILLEEGYRAFEDSGHAPGSLSGMRVGTYVGVGGGAVVGDDSAPHLSMLGSDTAITASRLAHFLDLKGPVLALNTACSSSLVAVDSACQALRAGSIDMALAGGITVWNHPDAFVSMSEAGMLSPTGTCRPFDDAADGTIVGDGVGLVVLKRLSDAERDGDFIYGLIRASGTNQDGRTSGITVPSYLAQSRLEREVYEEAGISPRDIQYVECHGTATKLGDPVEVHALTESLGGDTDEAGFCALGSLKGNIGHTSAASGVLGLIKLLQSLRHRQMPPAANYARANEHIDFAASPVFVNTELRDWPENREGVRLGAVSSFGYSGTNAHALVVEYPRVGAAGTTTPVVVVVSGQRAARLSDNVRALRDYLAGDGAGLDPAAVAWTLQSGRDAMDERLAFLARDIADIVGKLTAYLDGTPAGGLHRGSPNPEPGDPSTDFAADIEGWIAAGDLDRLANAWTKGSVVPWAHLYAGDALCRVPLPTYRFARDVYPAMWRGTTVKAEVEAPVVAPVPAPAPAPDLPGLMRFVETWSAVADAPPARHAPVSGTVLCVLSDDAAREVVSGFIGRIAPDAELVYLCRNMLDDTHALQEALADTDQIGTVLYLDPLVSCEPDGEAVRVAGLLQGLHAADRKPETVVISGACRDGLERAHLESLIGFERSIALAWPGVCLRVCLFGPNGEACIPDAWLARVWAEGVADTSGSVRYEGETRLELKIGPVPGAAANDAAPLRIGDST